MARPNRFQVAPGVTIYLRHKTWWVDIRAEGSRIQRNLRTHEYGVAVRKAHDLEKLPDRPSPKLVSFDTAVATYMDEYASIHHSGKTRERTDSILTMFRKFSCESLGDELFALERITRDIVGAYQRARMADGASPATVNAHIRHLRAFLRWCAGKGWIQSDPTREIRMLKVIKRDKGKILSPKEINRILLHLDSRGDELYADLLRLIANTGLRLGEALYLRSEDADLEGKRLHVRNRPDHLTKDREDRIVPINEVALAVLRRRKLAAGGDSGALLFPSRAGTPLDRHNVGRGFKKRATAAGVPDANWYALRHTFATRLAESVPEMALAAIMGHSDPKTTSRFYVHRNRMNLPTPPVVGLGG